MTTPGLRIGRYEVGARLGKGGFGVVHLARDIELGREVAIKFLRPEYLTRPQVVSRFLQEARACAKIGHPGIVTVFEAGLVSGAGPRLDGTAYIVMERLHGESLGERIETRGRLPPIAAIGIARQLAAALHVAHEAGIIHRDLKPDNVYLVRDAAVVGGERVKILDFGVAKLVEGDDSDVHTHSQMMLGTPRYMSPEQARAASKVDHRTDIYALGCLLYELVCGKPPFAGDLGDVIVAHQTVPITPPRELEPSVPPALDELIVRMLAKDPDHRPPSMTAVDDALDTVFGSLAPTRKRASSRRRAAGDDDDDKTTKKVRPEQLVEMPTPTPIAELPTLIKPPLVTRISPWMRVAIGLGAALVSGLIVYLILRQDGPTPVVARTGGADRDVAPPNITPIAVADAAEPPPDGPDAERLIVDCKTAQANKEWAELEACGHALAPLRSEEAKAFLARATSEAAARAALLSLGEAARNSDFPAVIRWYNKIPETSVYHQPARKLATTVTGPIIDGMVAELDRLASGHNCTAFASHLKTFEDRYGRDLADQARLIARPCARPKTAPPPPSPELEGCDADEVAARERRGDGGLADGNFAVALAAYESIFKCKPGIVSKLYMSACRARSFAKAKRYFQSVSNQAAMAQLCLKEGFDPRR